MILTVCMSPSVDVTLSLDRFCIGKMNIVKDKSRTYTGKAINVAIGVSRLGREVHSTGFMYREDASAFEEELRGEGIRTSFIYSDGRVRENYKIIDGNSLLTEINGIGAPVGKDKLDALLQAVHTLSGQADVTVVSGGLPEGVDDSFYGEIFKAVDKHSLRIADTEGKRLFAAIEAGVDLVKPNREELEHSLGRKLRGRADVHAACGELIARGARAVLLSLGREGAVLASGKKSYYCKSIDVPVYSTVGAGDGMVAAAAVKMQEGASLPEVLRAGVAAGTATVTLQGAVSFTKKKYSEIYAALSASEFE